MTMVKNEIIGKLRDFLSTNIDSLDFEIIDTDTDLIEAGVMDSLLMVMLVSFYEDELGIEVDPEELTEDNFRSLECMSEFASRRLDKRDA